MKYFWCIILHMFLNIFSGIQSQKLEGSNYENVISKDNIEEQNITAWNPHNAICNMSGGKIECICFDDYFPIDGITLLGCRDPCLEFQEKNAECVGIDAEKINCRCLAGYVPMHDGDPCQSCKIGNSEEIKITDLTPDNAVCNVTEDILQCKCIENHLPIDGDILEGCRDPCLEFHVRNADCSPIDSENYDCLCKDGHDPMYDDNPCNGCVNLAEIDPCIGFLVRNAECSRINSKDFDCLCQDGYAAMYDFNPCYGCINIKVKEEGCTAHDGYAFYENFGCLKAYDGEGNGGYWEAARAVCIKEGGDLFSPRQELPLLPEQLELRTDKNYGYWIGMRRYGSGPFERQAAIDQSEIPEDSPLWGRGWPKNEEGMDCVDVGSQVNLQNTICNTDHYYICQIYDL